MPKAHKQRTDAEFETYVDGELLPGLQDAEKSISYQELERQIQEEMDEVVAQRIQLLKHKKNIDSRVTALHAANEDLRKVRKRIRADQFSYTADPNTSQYEGGLNATWTPDGSNPYKGVFRFEGSAGFNNAENKSWFPLKYVPTDSDFSEYKGFEFSARVDSIAGTPVTYPAVVGWGENLQRCEHQLDADSDATHFRNPGKMYFRKKACDQPPASDVIDFVGDDKDLIFSVRPGYRLYTKMITRGTDGVDRTVSNIQLLDSVKAIRHMTAAQITSQDSDAKKWVSTRKRWVFRFDNVTDPKDNASAKYVAKNKAVSTGSACPRRYHSRTSYPQIADPLADGQTNAHGAVGYDKLCPRANVQSLEIDPYFKLDTWISADEIIEIEISDVKLFK